MFVWQGAVGFFEMPVAQLTALASLHNRTSPAVQHACLGGSDNLGAEAASFARRATQRALSPAQHIHQRTACNWCLLLGPGLLIGAAKSSAR